MTDDTSDDDEETPVPPSTVRDGEEMTDPEVGAAEEGTIYVDLRSSPSPPDLPNPAAADSRLEDLRARRELGILLPEQLAELEAREAGKDPEAYSFVDYCHDQGITDDSRVTIEREFQQEDAEDVFAELKDARRVDVDGDLEGEVTVTVSE